VGYLYSAFSGWPAPPGGFWPPIAPALSAGTNLLTTPSQSLRTSTRLKGEKSFTKDFSRTGKVKAF